MTDSDRLTRAEEALAHQAHAVEELSDLVRAQAERLDRLEALVEALRARAAEAEARGGHLFGGGA